MTKKDIEEYFGSHGTGKITEIKLMNGFGFIEYEDAMDARDVVPGMCFYRLGIRLRDRELTILFFFCLILAFRMYLSIYLRDPYKMPFPNQSTHNDRW